MHHGSSTGWVCRVIELLDVCALAGDLECRPLAEGLRAPTHP